MGPDSKTVFSYAGVLGPKSLHAGGGNSFKMLLRLREIPVRAIHRERINTEEKAKVVAAVWEREFIQFLDELAVLHWDDLKNMVNCTTII